MQIIQTGTGIKGGNSYTHTYTHKYIHGHIRQRKRKEKTTKNNHVAGALKGVERKGERGKGKKCA